MAFEGLSMSNIGDITTCNDLFLVVNDNQIKNVYDIFALKGDAASVSNTISTLDTATITKLQDLANNVTALTSFDSYINTQLALKSIISNVYYQGTVNSILNNYYTSNTSNTLFYTKPNLDNLLLPINNIPLDSSFMNISINCDSDVISIVSGDTMT